MTIALVIISDGRDDYLRQTIKSLHNVVGEITERWIFDDSGDDDYRHQLRNGHPDYQHIGNGTRRGFTHTMTMAWETLSTTSEADWILHLEQDFTFNRQVSLDDITSVMRSNPHLAQMALKRQPWNDEERAAGGFMEMYPESYVDHSDGEHNWLEHRRFFTCNPSVYPRSLTNIGWEQGMNTEGHFGLRLFREGTPQTRPEDIRCAFWGRRDDQPWVYHIGKDRIGIGY